MLKVATSPETDSVFQPNQSPSSMLGLLTAVVRSSPVVNVQSLELQTTGLAALLSYSIRTPITLVPEIHTPEAAIIVIALGSIVNGKSLVAAGYTITNDMVKVSCMFALSARAAAISVPVESTSDA